MFQYLLTLVAVLLPVAGLAAPLNSAFTYQGLLEDSGTPAAIYDFEIVLFDTACVSAPCGGAAVGPALFRDNIALDNGRFTLDLDFGDTFTGPDRFLELRVRRGTETGGFTQLLPRQRVAATPYAQHADGADFAAAVGAASITAAELAAGAVNASKIDTASVQARVTGACATGSAVRTISADGSVGCEAFPAAPTNPWSLSGNAGTNPSTNFLGTSDNLAFEIRTNNLRSLRLEPGVVGTVNLIGGNASNSVAANVRGATIAGGGINGTDPDFGAQLPNRGFDHYASIGGGLSNVAGSDDADPITGAAATVGGGSNNVASGRTSVVAGGLNNVAAGVNASIGGGTGNDVTGTSGTVAGGENNSAGQNDAVGGGASNTASGGNATVAGGASNNATQLTSTIGGGVSNNATAQSSTIAGGSINAASGTFSTIAGGQSNIASGTNAAIGGGTINAATNASATVGGGNGNTARGQQSTVAGGNLNCAGGHNSFAAGNRAKIRPNTAALPTGFGCMGIPNSGDTNGDSGTFVWADGQSFDLLSTNDNQFLVRAQNGVWFGTNSTPIIPAGSFIGTSTGAHLTTGGAWTSVSDRNRKDALQTIEPTEVLARVLAMPLYTWHYKVEDPARRHLGPMAQDFHAAFGLNGNDDKSITSVDADGVALAAIQGLNARLEAEAAALRAELAELRAQVRRLRAAQAEK